MGYVPVEQVAAQMEQEDGPQTDGEDGPPPVAPLRLTASAGTVEHVEEGEEPQRETGHEQQLAERYLVVAYLSLDPRVA